MGGFTKPILFNSVVGQRILRGLGWSVLTLFVLFVAAVLFPVYASAKVAAMVTENLQNLKALSVACSLYQEKNDGRFPLAANWYDATAPYLDTSSPIKDPWQDDNDFGYAMNADLSGKHFEDIADPARTILFYETKRPGKNLSSPNSGISADAYTKHRTSVVFSDSHKRSLSPKELLMVINKVDHYTP